MVLLLNPVVLQELMEVLLQDLLVEQDSWLHQSQHSRPESPDHHTTTAVFDCWCDVLFLFYSRCNGTHTFQKVQPLFHQSREYFPRSLGFHRDVFVVVVVVVVKSVFSVSRGFVLGPLCRFCLVVES